MAGLLSLNGFILAGPISVSSVGVLDPNPNSQTLVDAASNTAGGVTLANFKTMIIAAYANNTGGVLDFQELYQGGSWPNNNNGAANGTTVGNGAANPVVGSYGTSLSNTMSFYRLEGDTLLAADGIDANTNQGTNVISGGWNTSGGSGTGLVNFSGGTAVIDGTGSTAGGGYMGITGDGSPCTLVFSSNPLSAFGITGLPRGSSRATNIVFTLSDSTTFTTSNDLITTSAVFYGYQAPSGLSITKVQINNPNGVNRFDDLAFVVAVPEPASLILMGLSGVSLLVLRRRRG
jgi:hypothetical protein